MCEHHQGGGWGANVRAGPGVGCGERREPLSPRPLRRAAPSASLDPGTGHNQGGRKGAPRKGESCQQHLVEDFPAGCLVWGIRFPHSTELDPARQVGGEQPAFLHFLLQPALAGAFPPVVGKWRWRAKGPPGLGRRHSGRRQDRALRARAGGSGPRGRGRGPAAPRASPPPRPAAPLPRPSGTPCLRRAVTCFALHSAVAAPVAVAASS